MMDLVYVPSSKIRQIWPMVHKMVRNGVGRDNRRMNVPAIKEMALDGHWHMWVVWNEEKKIVKAVFFTEIYEEISGLKMGTIRFFSGEDRSEWKKLLSTLEEHMRSAGVQRMEIWARRGWLRELPEYKLTHVLLEKDLDDGIGQVKNDRPNHGSTAEHVEHIRGSAEISDRPGIRPDGGPAIRPDSGDDSRDNDGPERPIRSSDTGNRVPVSASSGT